MKFKSSKSIFLVVFIYGLSVLMTCLCIVEFINNGITNGNIALYPVMLCTIALILFLLLYTGYELKDETLYYHSGIIKGKIAVSRITEIIKGKTLYAGLKPATGTKGLIIKYDKYEEIYISPKTNESFIEAILKIKGDIIITK